MTSWIHDYLREHPEMSERRILERGANATHFEIAPGIGRAIITGAPQYFREGGEWHPIDLSLRIDREGWLGAPGARVRLRNNGETRIVGQGYKQRTLSVGILKDGEYSALYVLPDGRRHGRRLIREVGMLKHETILTERGAKEQLTLLEAPEMPSEGLFGYLTEVRVGARTQFTDVKNLRRDTEEYLVPGYVEDAEGKSLPFERHLLEISGTPVIFSGVPATSLRGAKYPVVVDPEINVTGETQDGYVRGYASGYSAARATSTDFSTNSDLFVGQALESAIPRYYVFRSFLKFDLGSLDPNATLLSATLALTRSTTFSINAEFDVQIVKVDWSASDPIGAGTKESAYDACLSGDTDVVWRNTSVAIVGQQYVSPPLEAGNVNLGETVYLGLRSSRDKAATAPTVNGDEYIRLASADHANAIYRPQMVIDYATVFPAGGLVLVPNASVGSYDTRNKLRARNRNQRLTTWVRSK